MAIYDGLWPRWAQISYEKVISKHVLKIRFPKHVFKKKKSLETQIKLCKKIFQN